MARFGEFETGIVVSETNLGAVYIARRLDTGSGEDRYALKVFQPPDWSVDEERLEQDTVAFLDGAEVQRRAGETGTGYWAPIYAADRCGGGAWYATDLYDRSVEKLILFRKDLEGAELQRLVESVVIGLVELRRDQGRPHGNIKPTNVLIAGRKDLTSGRISLTDPLPTARVRPEEDSQKDLRDLGDLIHQSVLHRPLRAASAWPVQVTGEWQRLGRAGESWLKLCNRLLDPTGKELPTLDEVAETLPGGVARVPLTGKSGSRGVTATGTRGRQPTVTPPPAPLPPPPPPPPLSTRTPPPPAPPTASRVPTGRSSPPEAPAVIPPTSPPPAPVEEPKEAAPVAEVSRAPELRAGRSAGPGPAPPAEVRAPDEELPKRRETPAVAEPPPRSPAPQPVLEQERPRPPAGEEPDGAPRPSADKKPWILWAAVGGVIVLALVGTLWYLFQPPPWPNDQAVQKQRMTVDDALAACNEAVPAATKLAEMGNQAGLKKIDDLVGPLEGLAKALKTADLKELTKASFDEQTKALETKTAELRAAFTPGPDVRWPDSGAVATKDATVKAAREALSDGSKLVAAYSASADTEGANALSAKRRALTTAADSLANLRLEPDTKDTYEKLVVSLNTLTGEVAGFRAPRSPEAKPEVVAAINAGLKRAGDEAAGLRAQIPLVTKTDPAKGAQLDGIAKEIETLATQLRALDATKETVESVGSSATRLDGMVSRAKTLIASIRTRPNPVIAAGVRADRSIVTAAEAVKGATFPDLAEDATKLTDAASKLRDHRERVRDTPDEPGKPEKADQEAQSLVKESDDLDRLRDGLAQRTKKIADGPVPEPSKDWATRLKTEQDRIAALASNASPAAKGEADKLKPLLAAATKAIAEPLPKGDAKGEERVRTAANAKIEALKVAVGNAEAVVVGGEVAAKEQRRVVAAGRVNKMIAALALGYLPEEAPPGGKSVVQDFKDLVDTSDKAEFKEWQSSTPEIGNLDRRLSDLKDLAGKSDVAELITALKNVAGKPDSVAEALVVWKRLVRDDQKTWPGPGAELSAAAGAITQIGDSLKAITDQARRDELAKRVAGDAKSLWSRHVAGLKWDDSAAVEAARAAMAGFGASQADLPGTARFNWLLFDLKTGLKSDTSDADVKSRAQQFVKDVTGLDATTAGRNEVVAARKAAEQISAPQGGGGGTADFTKVGPGTRGWTPTPGTVAGVPTVTYQAPAGGMKIEFAPVTTAAGASYLSTTEVSLAQFMLAIDSATDAAGTPTGSDAWKDMYDKAGLPLKEAKPLGPCVWAWLWPGETKPKLNTVGDGKGWLPFLPQMKMNNLASYPPELDKDVLPPELGMPMQHVTPAAAIQASWLLGCRLPSFGEWKAALEEEKAARAGAAPAEIQPNLRDATWNLQQEHCKSLRTKMAGQPNWPDGGVYIPYARTATVGKGGTAAPATTDDDRVLWFSPVARGGGVVFHHLIGNVAEFVWESLPASGAPSESTLAKAAEIIGKGDQIKVAGASALSPGDLGVNEAELDLYKPQPIDSLGWSKSFYSDVGFRLAFKAPEGASVESLASRAKKALGSITFLGPQ